jgi:hypothetical protein
MDRSTRSVTGSKSYHQSEGSHGGSLRAISSVVRIRTAPCMPAMHALGRCDTCNGRRSVQCRLHLLRVEMSSAAVRRQALCNRRFRRCRALRGV